jgi:hypothetical protein
MNPETIDTIAAKMTTCQVEGKKYFKWTVVIPPDEIEELGWEEGTELESQTEKGKLMLKRRSKQA